MQLVLAYSLEDQFAVFAKYLSIAVSIHFSMIIVFFVSFFHFARKFLVVLLLFSSVVLDDLEIGEAQSDIGRLQIHQHLNVLVFGPFIHELLHVLNYEHQRAFHC